MAYGDTTDAAKRKLATFDFNGPLDSQGEQERTDLNFSNRAAQSSNDTEYKSGLAELAAQEPKLNYQRDEGLRNNAANAGARGLIRSGILDTNRGKTWRSYLEGQQDLSRQRTALADRQKAAADRLNADYQQGLTGIKSNSIARRWDKWREENGGL